MYVVTIENERIEKRPLMKIWGIHPTLIKDTMFQMKHDVTPKPIQYNAKRTSPCNNIQSPCLTLWKFDELKHS